MQPFGFRDFQPEDEAERSRCAAIIDKVADPNIRQLTLRRLIYKDDPEALVVLAWTMKDDNCLYPLYSLFSPVRVIYVRGHPADWGMWDGFRM